MSISRMMQHYCGAIKSEDILQQGVKALRNLRENEGTQVRANNPHQLTRTLEVLNILTNAELILQACLARKASSKHLHFQRLDFPEVDPSGWHKFITLKLVDNQVTIGEKPIDYYGSLQDNYKSHNPNYTGE